MNHQHVTKADTSKAIYIEKLLSLFADILFATWHHSCSDRPRQRDREVAPQKMTAVVTMIDTTYGGIPVILIKNLSDCPLLLSVSLVFSCPETKTRLLFLCFLSSFLNRALISFLRLLISTPINWKLINRISVGSCYSLVLQSSWASWNFSILPKYRYDDSFFGQDFVWASGMNWVRLMNNLRYIEKIKSKNYKGTLWFSFQIAIFYGWLAIGM